MFYHFTKGFRNNLLVDIWIQPRHILGVDIVWDSVAFSREVVLNLAVLNGMKVCTPVDNVKEVTSAILKEFFEG